MLLKSYDIQDPVYKQRIKFCIGGTPEELLDLIRETDGGLQEDPGEFASGIVIVNRKDTTVAPTFWLWMKKFNGTVPEYAFLVHELVHLLESLLTWVEVTLCQATTEPCAGLAEHLFEQILRILRARKRKPNGNTKKAR